MAKANTCKDCKFTAKNKAGFSAHMRIKHKDAPKKMVAKTVKKAVKKKKSLAKNLMNSTPKVPKPKMPAICTNCNLLPAGSIELTGLLLVLVFSLTAVLFTSIFALERQQTRIEMLETELSVYISE